MKNKLGTTENMVEYHPNGKKSYEFITFLDGVSYERTFNERGNALTFKNSKGYTYERTYDEKGNQLTYKDSDGYYRIKEEWVTQKEYEAFIHSFGKKQTEVKLPSDKEVKVYEIDFGGELKTLIEVNKSKIIVIKAIDGWGNLLYNKDIVIKQTK
jgi:hypothetical protein